LIWKIRDLGLALSDRRAVKVLKLVAASALLSGRSKATRSDFWVLRYVWDREEQIDPLRSLVGSVLEQAASEEPETARHPLAEPPDRVDGEDLARQLDAVARQLDDAKERPLALLVAARLRDRLAELSDQASWVADDDARHHLIDRASALLNRLG
jgi:MoxR-like ATPase